jgi:hypothetical protein
MKASLFALRFNELLDGVQPNQILLKDYMPGTFSTSENRNFTGF